ncbi:hypothetical protein LY78DRAFT_650776 [Colletotrichum sublineola]|nr:hypothetical protein LY78DRAFT_650776 [Colletotrichum sublineola]
MALHLSPSWPTIWAALAALSIAVKNTLAQECNYVGGWSLRFPSSSCPQDAPFDCGKAGDLQMRCCPTGLSCAGNGSYAGNYCCPDSADSAECQELAFEYPKCPDTTWSLWATNDTTDNAPKTGAWCCEPGSMGIYRDNGTAHYFCTATTITTLQTSFYWAKSMTTAPCSATASIVISSTTDRGTFAPSSTSSSGSTNNSESSGASSGVIAGAVVGALAIITLIGVGYFLYLRRKKSKFEVTQAVNMGGSYGQETPRNDTKRRRVSELETVEPRLEMDGTKPTYELDATVENIQEEGYSPKSTRPT